MKRKIISVLVGLHFLFGAFSLAAQPPTIWNQRSSVVIIDDIVSCLEQHPLDPFRPIYLSCDNNIEVNYTLTQSTVLTAAILDAKGNVVKMLLLEEKQQEGRGSLSVNFDELPRGVYYVVLIDGEGGCTLSPPLIKNE